MLLRNLSMRHWSEQIIIALVMQTRDNSITCFTKRGLLGRRKLTSKQGHGEPNPTWIPVGHDAVRRIATKIKGFAGGGWNDVFNIPMTAHFLGGAPDRRLARAPGVIDPYHRVYGHPGLHVVDGAAVSANLGVNPSLTITAQAERAMALWPNAGATTRAPARRPYQRLAPVAPRSPAVPPAPPASSGWCPWTCRRADVGSPVTGGRDDRAGPPRRRHLGAAARADDRRRPRGHRRALRRPRRARSSPFQDVRLTYAELGAEVDRVAEACSAAASTWATASASGARTTPSGCSSSTPPPRSA